MCDSVLAHTGLIKCCFGLCVPILSTYFWRATYLAALSSFFTDVAMHEYYARSYPVCHCSYPSFGIVSCCLCKDARDPNDESILLFCFCSPQNWGEFMHNGRYSWFVANAAINRVLPCWVFLLALSSDAFPLTSRVVRMIANAMLVLIPAADLYTLRRGKLEYLSAAPVIPWFLFETTTAQLQSIAATNISLFAIKYCIKAMLFRRRLQLLSAPFSVAVTRSHSDSSSELADTVDASNGDATVDATAASMEMAPVRVD
jgi:hypothetical protein